MHEPEGTTMNTNDCDANRLTSVDIELPLVDQDPSAWDGLGAVQAYVETAFEVLGETATPLLPASLEDVAAHPSRLRMTWSGPVSAGQPPVRFAPASWAWVSWLRAAGKSRSTPLCGASRSRECAGCVLSFF